MWHLISGLLLGLLSSVHCVGMCGPLAMALPVQHLPRRQQLMQITLYHVGRVFTYTFLGAFFALLGRGIYIAGIQQWFSIGVGVVMLFGLKLKFEMFYAKVQAAMIKYMRYSFLFGMVNGLLPCGMVYIDVTGAMTTGNIFFMTAFGIGTLPAMIALSMFSMRIKLSHRQHLKRIMPYAIAGIAILFILRGLNLGIPFISPVLPASPKQVISCH